MKNAFIFDIYHKREKNNTLQVFLGSLIDHMLCRVGDKSLHLKIQVSIIVVIIPYSGFFPSSACWVTSVMKVLQHMYNSLVCVIFDCLAYKKCKCLKQRNSYLSTLQAGHIFN